MLSILRQLLHVIRLDAGLVEDVVVLDDDQATVGEDLDCLKVLLVIIGFGFGYTNFN